MERMVEVGGITTQGWSPGNGGDNRDGWNNHVGVVPWNGGDGWRKGWGGPLGMEGLMGMARISSLGWSPGMEGTDPLP